MTANPALDTAAASPLGAPSRPGFEPGAGAYPDNPYLAALYAPVREERVVEHDQMTVEGTLPGELSGVYFRNGPNPQFEPRQRYHWFDGDGMVHAVRFDGGRATYRNRWVRTDALALELASGEALWNGLLEPRQGNPDGFPEKDSSNTDVIVHAGRLVSLWYRAGAPYTLDPITLETTARDGWGADLPCTVSAHAKVDEHTEEVCFFDYGDTPPYMRYGVVGRDGAVSHLVDIDLPGPRLPHDMAITEHYSILMDLPLINDPEAARAGRYRTRFERDLPSRFGVIPRHGAGSEIRWFEADPTYIYHSVNAWEDGDEVVMTTCRITDVAPRRPMDGPLGGMLASLRPDAVTNRYRFNLRTGATVEEIVDDRSTEFPAINQSLTGRPNRYSYQMHIADEPTMLHDGVLRYDIVTGESTAYWFGAGRWGTEAAFAPRPGATDEDDGWLILYVSDVETQRTDVEILDGRDIAAGPVCRLRLPVRVPLGFHATWAGDARLGLA